MKFVEISKFLSEVEQIKSRNEIAKKIAGFIDKIPINDLKISTYFLFGKIAPDFENIKFNLSSKLVEDFLIELLTIKDTQKNYELKNIILEKEIENYKKNIGDIGEISEKVREKINTPPTNLEVFEVYQKLKNITTISGKNSISTKKNLFCELLKELDPISCKYIVRIIIGEMRTGFSEKTFLEGLSILLTGNKTIKEKLELHYGYCSDIGMFTENIIKNYQVNKNIDETLKKIIPKPFIPILPKLVERESDPAKILTRIPKCIAQPKLDGLRGQIHLENKKLKIFTRNLEDITSQFPDIIEDVLNLKVESLILDCEIVGYDFTKETLLSYQETMQRKRKFQIEVFKDNIPAIAMCFDLIYLNGQNLTYLPLKERLNKLQELINTSKSNNKHIQVLETKEINTVDYLKKYFHEQIEKKLEGIIVKNPESIYEPGTRNFEWIKLKANTIDDFVDTIDVVVMGYYYGKGNRNRFGFGSLLVGVYDEENEKYTTIGKVGSGFTEEEMIQIYSDLEKISIKEKPSEYIVDKSLEPDVWTKPKIIVEIIADEITRSPVHSTAKNIEANVEKDNSKKGLSIRFPRLKIWKRDKDKPNTTKEIIRMYEIRKQK